MNSKMKTKREKNKPRTEIVLDYSIEGRKFLCKYLGIHLSSNLRVRGASQSRFRKILEHNITLWNFFEKKNRGAQM